MVEPYKMVCSGSTMVNHELIMVDHGLTIIMLQGPADNHFWLSMARLMASFRGQFTGFSLGHLHMGEGTSAWGQSINGGNS